jgi:hypothetical protein
MSSVSDLMLTIAKWPLALSVVLIVVLSVGVSWAAVFAVRRVWPYPTLRENNELVGFTYAVYGLVYGVLLAFTIVATWQHFAEAEQLVIREATILSVLWRDSENFPAPIREGIHANLSAYGRSVVEREWPTMADRGRADVKSQRSYENLWLIAYRFEPATQNQQAFFREFLERMNEFSVTRRSRILYSRMELHVVLWLVLLLGGIPVVAYTLLFSGRHAWLQVAIMANVMLIVMLGLLVTLLLQYPFTGQGAIRPDAFREVLQSFSERP